jgi:hypothetical protein
MASIYVKDTNPKISDIQYFFNKIGTRADNDDLNKIREKCLHYLPIITREYLENIEYGQNWTKLKDNFNKLLLEIGPKKPYDNFVISRKGGMNNNYDYEFLFEEFKEPIMKLKIEFKFNNNNITKLPQFLELYDCKVNLCSITYTAYFYSTYLDSYLKTDVDLNNTKISFETYSKYVIDINYKHPFFNLLYSRKDFYKKDKHAIVHESIKNYIYSFHKLFNFTDIENKIREQYEKIYLLWDNDKFITHKVDTSRIKINNIIVIRDKYFDVEVNEIDYNIRFRINWGNNNGIANPRWKLSYIKKNNVIF